MIRKEVWLQSSGFRPGHFLIALVVFQSKTGEWRSWFYDGSGEGGTNEEFRDSGSIYLCEAKSLMAHRVLTETQKQIVIERITTKRIRGKS